MNSIRISKTKQGLPSVTWVQSETAIDPRLFGCFIHACMFCAAPILAYAVLRHYDDFFKPNPYAGVNPIFFGMALLFATIASLLVVAVFFSLPLYLWSLRHWQMRSIPGSKRIVEIAVPGTMYVETSINFAAQLVYAAPWLKTRKTPLKTRLKYLDANEVSGFFVDTAARWLKYSGEGVPDANLILAQLHSGQVEVVAFDCGSLYQLTDLHATLQKTFITQRPRDGWGAAPGAGEKKLPAPLPPRPRPAPEGRGNDVI